MACKQDHLMKITNLLEHMKDRDKERDQLISENKDLKQRVDELMVMHHQSDNSKLSKLAMELEKKDEEIRNIVKDKSDEIHELKVNRYR